MKSLETDVITTAHSEQSADVGTGDDDNDSKAFHSAAEMVVVLPNNIASHSMGCVWQQRLLEAATNTANCTVCLATALCRDAVLRMVQQQNVLCQCSTMECSQPAAWTMNLSLLVASGVKAFPGRPKNLTRPYPDLYTRKVIFLLSSVSSPSTREVLRHLRTCDHPPLSLSSMPTSHHLHPYPHPTHHSYD